MLYTSLAYRLTGPLLSVQNDINLGPDKAIRTACSRLFLRKLLLAQLVNKFPAFVERQVPLSSPQPSATKPYLEPAEASDAVSLRSILI